MSAIVDVIQDASARRTADGLEVTRVALVRDLVGSASQRLVSALTAAGLPAYGSPHPNEPGSLLQSIEADPVNSNDSVLRVRLTYSPRAASTQARLDNADVPNAITGIRFQAVSVQEQTNEDRFGVRMLNKYTGPEGIVSELVTVSLNVPRLQVSINKNLVNPPKEIATDYIGRVNSAPWSGYSPRTWLCTDIQSQQRDGLWRTDYTFLYRPETWDTEHVLKIGGVTPSKSREGNGVATYENYEQANFNVLGVAF